MGFHSKKMKKLRKKFLRWFTIRQYLTNLALYLWINGKKICGTITRIPSRQTIQLFTVKKNPY